MKEPSNKKTKSILTTLVILNVVYTLFLTFYLPQVSSEIFADCGHQLTPLFRNLLTQSNMYQKYVILSLPLSGVILFGLIKLVSHLGHKKWVAIILSILLLGQVTFFIGALGTIELQKSDCKFVHEMYGIE